MEIFRNWVLFLELKTLPIKEKSKLKQLIKENGGTISYVINQKCTHVIGNDCDTLSPWLLKKIQKYEIPVLSVKYVLKCIEEGRVLETQCCIPAHASKDFSEPSESRPVFTDEVKNCCAEESLEELFAGKLRIYNDSDSDIPPFPEDFEVAKYSLFEKSFENETEKAAVVELQCSQQDSSFLFRISGHLGLGLQSGLQKKQFLFASTSEDAVDAYEIYIQELLEEDFELKEHFPLGGHYLISSQLQKVLFEESLNVRNISQEVGVFVETIWREAHGCLEDVLLCPVNSISPNDVSRAEGVLLQLRRAIDDGANPAVLKDIMSEFYRLIPHKKGKDHTLNKKILSAKQDLCQLIRDVVNAHEATMGSTLPSSLFKYRALQCHIQHVEPSSDEFLQVKNLVLESSHSDSPIEVLKIFQVARVNESVEFQSKLGTVLQLFHASAVSNFVGILSRGLLLPKIVVEDHGVERTDIGNLGSGIYFSDSVSISIKYSKPSATDGTRLLLVCDVALGTCKELSQKIFSLTSAPKGFHSVHGVHRTEKKLSDFEDDEFVVYNTNQLRIKYVVQFLVDGDQKKPFQPSVNISTKQMNTPLPDAMPKYDPDTLSYENLIEGCKHPLEDKAGLQDNSGNCIPLEEVHMKGRILDFTAQVIIFQKYKNQSSVPIEAKYVFPLGETAAVCGFEAFINGKHIIGEVKEKEQAHHEYRQAVKEGHGAYLMDQDAPDVFTVSVGNLPPNATVLIKITYITELSVNWHNIEFFLPGTVAPWQQDKALNENTQETVEKVCINTPQECAFSAEMSIEMPYPISDIYSWTHKIKIKKTDCKAVVCTEKGSSLSKGGLYLQLFVADIFQPRLWIEKHPDKDSEACMVVFFPSHGLSTPENESSAEMIICLDCSNSMMGLALQQAQKIAAFFLHTCCSIYRINVITFGTDYKELFQFSRHVDDPWAASQKFIQSATAIMGNSDFWKPLYRLNLLPPSKGFRNILLISDGHLQNESLTFQLIKKNVKHTRIFTCGVGSTANRHLLRSLARYGGGTYEFFDEKTKYNWLEKINLQKKRMISLGCTSVSVKWQQFSRNAPEPIQAPNQIRSLFDNDRLLLYGFAARCTQVALHGMLNEKEIQTMVSTTELQKTKGTMLHKLTARAIIRDYEHGSLHEDETEHEMKKALLKSLIIKLSKEYSIITQFTSFVAIEKRGTEEAEDPGAPNIEELIAKDDVDILQYMDWREETDEAVETLQVEKDKLESQETSLNKCDLGNSLESFTMEDFCFDGSVSDILQGECTDAVDFSDSQSLHICASSSNVEKNFHIQYKLPESVLPPPPFHLAEPQFSVFSNSHWLEAGICIAEGPLTPSGICPVDLSFSRQSSVAPVEQVSKSISFASSAPIQPAFGTVCNLFAFPSSAPTRPVIGSSSFSFSSPMQLPFGTGSSGFGSSAPTQPMGGTGSFGFASPVPKQPVADSGLFGFSAARRLGRGTDSLQLGFSGPAQMASGSDFVRLSAPVQPDIETVPLVFGSKQLVDESGLFHSASTQPVSGDGSVGIVSYQLAKKCVPHFSPKLKKRGCLKSSFSVKLLQEASLQLEAENIKIISVRTKNCLIPWTQLFQLQSQDGYWQLSQELGLILELDEDYLINVFLKQKGIQSLGLKGKENLLQLIATLLVLQLIHFTQQLEGIVLKSLLKLDEPTKSSTIHWAFNSVKKAVKWAKNVDGQYSAICNRLQLGRDWESATRQLLRIDPIKASSPLYRIISRGG
ncbi:protein mono-ADP-ribosyltransferase PARP4 isoform X2 [Latimeria chalumnae]|uniref:protein mono-ADP-ribosyltransferase PARP4 isoform X2 n=1 Tax=Latimeria chalumnae TaxID=7897 RepID=UPI00313E0C57